MAADAPTAQALADMERLGRPSETSSYQFAERGRLDEGLWVVSWVQLMDDTVSDAAFEVYGSLEALAVANWLAGAVTGRTRAEACQVAARDAVDALALPVEAGGAALRIEDALQQALACDNDGGSNEY